VTGGSNREHGRSTTERRYALVAGGGTAGHLLPAIAIAEALVEAGHERGTIEFVGSERGQDADMLADRGFPVTLLPGRGIVRSLAPRDLVRSAASGWELLVAARRAIRLVGRARPQVVVAVGGYASLAGCVAAVVHRVPLVLVNVDAVPGAANRLFGRFAAASAVGWDGNPLPRAVVTGTPVRPQIVAVDRTEAGRAAAKAALGLPAERMLVVAFGGSLGARQINRAVDGMGGRWRGRDDVMIYHIVGRRDWDGVAHESGLHSERSGVADAGAERVEDRGPGGAGPLTVRVPYEERMPTVYAAADLVVCRAGAMTVAELAAAGVPAVLVPLPGAPGDHQTANARVLEQVGAAALLADPECTPAGLTTLVESLLLDGDRLEDMGRAAKGLGRPDAAAAGAAVVDAHARTARRS
jgi:UDP-N-acetylglucosamine--N-acetylmuramyl-(pentapeptide) pyrophosphoryl-undecaprenol N-acetylglucosamine transferase